MDEQQRQFKESWERIDSRSTKWVTRSAEKMAMWAHSGRSEYDIKRKILEYSSLSTRNRYIQNTLQIIITFGAGIVPFLLNIPDVPKMLPTIISAVVAVAALIGNQFKFGERSRNYYLAAEELQQEYNWYETDRGSYENTSPEVAVAHFMDQTEAIMHKYNQHILSLESQSEKDKIKEV